LRIIVLFMGLLAGTAVAAQPLQALKDYFDSVRTLTGSFVQETRDETGTVVDRSTGDFAISRPDRFAWHYRTPFEQRIIADGRWLVIYDVGLQQVTVRPQERVLGVGPAVLLSGDYRTLQENFELRPADDGWIELKPRDGEWEFQSVRLRLVDGIPAVVEVNDGLGQTTRLELHDLEPNVPIDPQRFEFSPPPEADVIAPPEYDGPGS
jgi:chaperone LolA